MVYALLCLRFNMSPNVLPLPGKIHADAHELLRPLVDIDNPLQTWKTPTPRPWRMPTTARTDSTLRALLLRAVTRVTRVFRQLYTNDDTCDLRVSFSGSMTEVAPSFTHCALDDDYWASGPLDTSYFCLRQTGDLCVARCFG